ncbi:tetratricopeptide repeat protein [Gracilimonas sp.]|uniref:tetratricopeptide repeat protein n=1 Tax=Gracilimonas sp. TaxID=1974203 RepID=UPI002871953D|nr:tetratricopeptide repeat protein [Gracilimonas sp.]
MRSAFILSVAIFLVLFVPKNSYSQQQEADSLYQSLQRNAPGNLLPDTSNINTLNDLATNYRYTDMDSLLKYVELAQQLAEDIGYSKGYFESLYLRGWYHFYKGEYRKSLEVSNSGLAHPDIFNFPEKEALLNQLIGTSYASQGDYHLGLNYFLRALELYRQVDKDIDEFQILNNIGVSYFQLEDYERALEIFEELDSLRTLSSQSISLPVNLGFINYELGNLDEAEKQLMRIINYEGEEFDQRAIGLSTYKLGQIYLQRNQYPLALENFNRSIEVYDQYEKNLKKYNH